MYIKFSNKKNKKNVYFRAVILFVNCFTQIVSVLTLFFKIYIQSYLMPVIEFWPKKAPL